MGWIVEHPAHHWAALPRHPDGSADDTLPDMFRSRYPDFRATNDDGIATSLGHFELGRRRFVTAASTAASCSVATSSKGSKDRSARDRTTAPSKADINVVAKASALSWGTPPSARSLASRDRFPRKTSPARSSKVAEFAATVTATIAQPAAKSDLAENHPPQRGETSGDLASRLSRQLVECAHHLISRSTNRGENQFILPAWEVMIKRTTRRARRLEDLAERRALKTLLREQDCGPLNHPLSDAPGQQFPLLTIDYDVPHSRL